MELVYSKKGKYDGEHENRLVRVIYENKDNLTKVIADKGQWTGYFNGSNLPTKPSNIVAIYADLGTINYKHIIDTLKSYQIINQKQDTI